MSEARNNCNCGGHFYYKSGTKDGKPTIDLVCQGCGKPYPDQPPPPPRAQQNPPPVAVISEDVSRLTGKMKLLEEKLIAAENRAVAAEGYAAELEREVERLTAELNKKSKVKS